MIDLSKFSVGCKVRIDVVVANYYYIGQVLESSKDSITIKDRNGQIVSLSSLAILFIREVKW